MAKRKDWSYSSPFCSLANSPVCAYWKLCRPTACNQPIFLIGFIGTPQGLPCYKARESTAFQQLHGMHLIYASAISSYVLKLPVIAGFSRGLSVILVLMG
jgi:hypothetical protein